VHSNEVKNRGGLRKHLPLVHLSFLIACLAIAGVFPLAGFFSKEEILLAAFNANRIVFGGALLTAGLTAFYMFRLYFLVFWGKPTELHSQHHTSWVMSVPLLLLTICTVVVGWLPFSSHISWGGTSHHAAINWIFSAAPLGISAMGIFIAYLKYARPSEGTISSGSEPNWLYHAAVKKFYIDEVYLWITHSILTPLVARPFAWFDRNVVDGLIHGVADGVANCYYFFRRMQSGKLQDYLLYFMGGIAAWMIFFFYLWK
jgi:NADH-quinone oxidoreductase subunit L